MRGYCQGLTKNALANRLATCSWLNDIDLLMLCFNNGMPDGMRSGSRRANRIISGRVSVKKAVDSAASNSCKYNIDEIENERKESKNPMLYLLEQFMQSVKFPLFSIFGIV